MGIAPEYIRKPCQLEDLSSWLLDELKAIPQTSIRKIICEVSHNLPEYIYWPKRAELLWDGCDRARENAQKQRYHSFPPELKGLAKSQEVRLDGRSNGPAIAAYLIAGGERPNRHTGNYKWSIHHIYNGKFPYPGRENSLHAVKDPKHFTQSAGLVAIHPIADQMCDEYPFIAWLLRAESYKRFGYDPDGVFGSRSDKYGFVEGKTTVIRYSSLI